MCPFTPNSANFVTDLLRQISAYYGPNVGINTKSFSSPVYFPSADTPRISVAQWNCQGKSSFPDPGLTSQWSSVPVPSYAQTADPQEGTGVYTDAEITILQGDTLFEFWKARKTSTGQWQGCWGGRLDNVSTNPGIWPYPYGASATGLPYIGGQVTAEELQAGVINHVIGISLVDLEAYSTFSWLAVRSDGYNPNQAPNRIPEGLRFRLNPSVNLDALNPASGRESHWAGGPDVRICSVGQGGRGRPPVPESEILHPAPATRSIPCTL